MTGLCFQTRRGVSLAMAHTYTLRIYRRKSNATLTSNADSMLERAPREQSQGVLGTRMPRYRVRRTRKIDYA
jgi:hypothetical protein